jgi:hypothetical protein
LTSFAWILPFCAFFCRWGYVVAGFLTIRFSFRAIDRSPFDQDEVGKQVRGFGQVKEDSPPAK